MLNIVMDAKLKRYVQEPCEFEYHQMCVLLTKIGIARQWSVS